MARSLAEVGDQLAPASKLSLVPADERDTYLDDLLVSESLARVDPDRTREILSSDRWRHDQFAQVSGFPHPFFFLLVHLAFNEAGTLRMDSGSFLLHLYHIYRLSKDNLVRFIVVSNTKKKVEPTWAF